MKEPNVAARLLMKSAALETAKISKAFSEMLALWNQVTEHLVAGNVLEADRARVTALSTMHSLQSHLDTSAERIKALRHVDLEYWNENVRLMERDVDDRVEREMLEVISNLSLPQARLELAMHMVFCPNRDCPVERALKARIAILEKA